MAAVFDAAAVEYEATGTAYFNPMGQHLVDLARLQPGQRVLDLGTGRGAVLHPAATAVGPTGQVVGVDASARMAALTTADLARTDEGVASAAATAKAPAAVVVADAARPPLAAGFDVVLGGMLAQFLPAPAAALASWAALVVPGGQLGLSWWAGDDAGFAGVDAAVAAHLPGAGAGADDRSRGHRVVRAFSGDVALTEALVAGAGWTQVTTTVQVQQVRFADTSAWWRWSWSHGQRRRWEAVRDVAALRHDVDIALDRLAASDGSITYRPQAAFTLARTPVR